MLVEESDPDPDEGDEEEMVGGSKLTYTHNEDVMQSRPAEAVRANIFFGRGFDLENFLSPEIHL